MINSKHVRTLRVRYVSHDLSPSQYAHSGYGMCLMIYPQPVRTLRVCVSLTSTRGPQLHTRSRQRIVFSARAVTLWRGGTRPSLMPGLLPMRMFVALLCSTVWTGDMAYRWLLMLCDMHDPASVLHQRALATAASTAAADPSGRARHRRLLAYVHNGT